MSIFGSVKKINLCTLVGVYKYLIKHSFNFNNEISYFWLWNHRYIKILFYHKNVLPKYFNI